MDQKKRQRISEKCEARERTVAADLLGPYVRRWSARLQRVRARLAGPRNVVAECGPGTMEIFCPVTKANIKRKVKFFRQYSDGRIGWEFDDDDAE